DPRGRQDVGGPRPAGTAVFQTAYRPHHQLAATLTADALWAAPDNNAGPPAGVITVYTTGLMPSAARSNQLPTQRVGTRKRMSVIPGADKMSAVPGQLGPPSFRRLTDPITSCWQRPEQTPSGPHPITPDRRQV
ncbi:hypothetical protein, partial [Candidatus Thiosymbion oneisti]|uniref:hypothetical protein n=1 Tax=Candidatus Thiosymbion oneisti TaxID=589554 RepID=UPI001AAC88B8